MMNYSTNNNQISKYNEINKKRYHILKEYPINCPVCQKLMNLSLITKHINFSKKCKMMQSIKYNDIDELNDIKRKIKNNLTLIRYKIKNNIDVT